jgi:hypothetical protein
VGLVVPAGVLAVNGNRIIVMAGINPVRVIRNSANAGHVVVASVFAGTGLGVIVRKRRRHVFVIVRPGRNRRFVHAMRVVNVIAFVANGRVQTVRKHRGLVCVIPRRNRSRVKTGFRQMI